ncbi:aldehyde reductase II [Stemphylium lycopersici]|uniref:Aldehyde reductase II n=1 Tax=Stemphylium lycopersici TaxID=183478 RepID=A0A364MVS0_STELY|nr:aldehyde reductase [Stemphylium lycopersici]RAR00271.1 aldehyde reductase II [Stemphylium lycopersici]RAR05162.1 aldehyde reductase II [Stemphylium lycopersici]
MFDPSNARLPLGSTIFVTGVTGYIGSWVAHEALSLGYNVRGAVRSLSKAAWLQSHFDSTFGPGRYTQVHLSDSSDSAGFRAGIKGVAGIAHVAVNTARSTEADPYVPNMVSETVEMLKAAHAEPSVRSVVFTSTSLAVAEWGAKGRLDKKQYNEAFIAAAWDPDFQHPSKTFFVYAAAKAASEKAAWAFMDEAKPPFAFNVILPNCNFGPSLVFEKQGWPSTAGFPKALFDGDATMIASIPPMYHIDVRDDARLHVAALLHPDISNDRLWGFADKFTWNTVLAIYRRLWPARSFPTDFPDLEVDQSEAPTESALMALKEVFGQEGWVSLEDSLKDARFDREFVGESQKMDIFN